MISKNILNVTTLLLFVACSDEQPSGSVAAAPSGLASEDVQSCVDRQIDEQRGEPQAIHCGVSVTSCPADGAAIPVEFPAGLERLRTLDLTGRCIGSVESIAHLTSLEKLALASNNIRDLGPLRNLKRLIRLDLANNPIQANWGVATKEPFSSLNQLEELDLADAVGGQLYNVIPLEALTSLRVLNLRNAPIGSVRVLRNLKGLRVLNVEHTGIADLSPLAGHWQLESLLAKDNQITSVKPLKALVAHGWGRLKNVSVTGNCVVDCSLLDGASVVACSESQSTGCDPEYWLEAQKLSVPVTVVEQYAPTLPDWTREQLDKAYRLITTEAGIDWNPALDNCHQRAMAVTSYLAGREGEFPAHTYTFVYGNLHPLNHAKKAGYASFPWHVAVTVRVRHGSGRYGFFVLDPAYASEPISLHRWFERMIDTSRGVDENGRPLTLNLSCQNYYADLVVDPEAYCKGEVSFSGLALDQDGNFVLDSIDNVRATIAYDTGVVP